MNDPAFSHNQQILEDLEWAIAANEGEFELLLVRYDYGLLLEKILTEWNETTELNLGEFKLQLGGEQLLSRLQKDLNTYVKNENHIPQGLIIHGFEKILGLEGALSDLNQSRDELKNICPFPVIICLNSQHLKLFSERAKDLKNWASPPMHLQMPSSWLIEQLEERFVSLVHLLDEDSAGDTKQDFEFWADHYLGEKRFAIETDAIAEAIKDRKIGLSSAEQGHLSFLQGWRYRHSRSKKAKEFYKEAITLFSESNAFHRAISEMCLGDIWLQEKQYQQAKSLYQSALQEFIAVPAWMLLHSCTVNLGRTLRALKDWDSLEVLAKDLIESQEKSNYFNRYIVEGYAFLAEVFLRQKKYPQVVEQVDLLLPNAQDCGAQNLETYGLLGAIAYEQEGDHEQSWEAWLRVLQFSDAYREQLDYFFGLIEELYNLYFANQQFVDAYRVKLEWRSLEQQYGKIAFVGASRLKPLRRVKQDSRQDEFAASGRQEDVQLIMERLSRPKHKLTILYGQSGVGKSSMIDAGLLPAIRRKKFINNRDLQPILVRNYGDWQGAIADLLKSFLGEGAEGGRGSRNLSQPTPNPSQEGNSETQQTDPSFLGEGARRAEGVSVGDATNEKNTPAPFKDGNELLADLKQIADQDNLVVLIFDQFEEFFFTVTDPKEQRQFFEFLRDCLNTPFIKIILSLREDYLHLLLQGTRNLDLGAIDNNLLHRDVIHYIGNFSPEAAKNVIRFLIDGSEVNFSDELIDILVEDLTTELGEVRPIELQIVGQQIQRDIRTKEEYLANGTEGISTKEILIDRYLEAAIADCGEPNEQIARLILYYLTDEDEHKVLKSLAELENDLEQWQEKFQIAAGQIAETVDILVISGLVVEILEPEVSQYQLVHDYLIRPIRKSQISTIDSLNAELNQERSMNLELVAENTKIEIEIKAALAIKKN